MKLYHSPASPFVRKVMVLLHETGQLADVEIVPTTTSPMTPAEALKSKNPLAKIPALERAVGPTLYDSRVICAYLDARAGGRFYPGGAARWDTLTLEATADGIMDAAVSMSYELRLRPEDHRWEAWIEGQWRKVAGAIAALNGKWMSHLSGRPDMGHIAVACALGYVDFRHDARNWRQGNDALAAWFDGFETRPGMVATRPHAA